jgi:hypothetical protein
MTHHQQARRESLALIPKFWQPKAAPSRQLTTSIYHWDILSKFTSGEANAQTMWDWIEAALVYSEMTRRFIAEGLPVTDEAISAIDEQLEIVAQVIDRFAATGRVGFSGTELLIARAAGHVMDQLIAADRHGIAWHSIMWARIEVDKMKVVTA